MSATSDARAAVDQAIDALQVAAQGDQQGVDQVTIDRLTQELAGDTNLLNSQAQQIADLQQALADCQNVSKPQVLYGSEAGGWWYKVPGTSLGTLPIPQANQAVVDALGPLSISRSYSGESPRGIDQTRTIMVWQNNNLTPELIQNRNSLPVKTIYCHRHEPENDSEPLTTQQVKDWQAQQLKYSKMVKDNSDTAEFTTIHMGSTFMVDPDHPRLNRYTQAAQGNVPWTDWYDFDLTYIDYIGGDCYQHGKGTSGTPFDSPEEIIMPLLNAAKSLGKLAGIGEFGARRVDKCGLSPNLPDQARADWLTKAIALMDANAAVLRWCLYFNSSNGADNLAPWPVVAPPSFLGAYSPLSLAVWKAACQRVVSLR